MNFSFRWKYRFFNTFREIFVHHHGSLEFRAKVFALIIAANEEAPVESFIVVKEIASDIYNTDEDRASLLMYTTKEIVDKVRQHNGLDLDLLIESIQKELKIVPRYAKKIDIKALKSLVLLTYDEDTIAYQERILEFLTKLKNEYLQEG